jgi:hypothetical protein
MGRHLVTAAIVLGILETAMHVLSLGSLVLMAFNDEMRGHVSAWWVVQGVGSMAVRTAWTALVSYAAVQVCRRVVAAREANTR